MLIPDPVALGAVVRKRRSALGMSQTQLANKVGTTRQWLSRFEQGTNDVSIAIVFAILGALDLEIEIADPQSNESPMTGASTPATVMPVLPVPPVANPETSTDRFALLRSRDALAGLRMPGWVPSARNSAVPNIGKPPVEGASVPKPPVSQDDLDTKIPENQAAPTAHSKEHGAGDGQGAKPVQDAEVSKADQEHRVIPLPVRPGPKASHRMDQDIARIKKSSLFKR